MSYIYIITMGIHRPKLFCYSKKSITALKVQSIEHIYLRKIGFDSQQNVMVAHIIKTLMFEVYMSLSTI